MKYDLIVVGAGVLGAFHAYHAAILGKTVLLLEKDEKPQGSTVQNFGQVVPSGLSENWQKFGRRSLEIYKELQLKTQLSVTQNGSIYIASNEDEHLLLEEIQSIHLDRNYESILLTQKSIKARIPSIKTSYAKAALYYPQEISVNPLEMIHHLISFMKERHKVEFKPNSEVLSVQNIGHEIRATTIDGTIFTAESAIICSGYYLKNLFPDFLQKSNLVASKLQMMRTAPHKELIIKPNVLTGLSIRRYESFRECPSFEKIKTSHELSALQAKGIHILFKQEADGRIIIGDSHEYAPISEIESLGEENNAEIDNLILQEARRILNHPLEHIEHKWSGFYVQHQNDIVDEYLDPCIKVVTGIGGKGMTSSAGYAEESIRSFYQL